MRKLTYSYVFQQFKNKGKLLLENNYINNNKPMKYQCSCGNVGYITYNQLQFRKSNYCLNCKPIWNKKNIEEVYDFFKKNDCELLEKDFINTHTKMKYRCSCGNISYITFHDFKSGHRCMNCGSKERSGDKNGKWNPEMTNDERKEAQEWIRGNEHKIWVKTIFQRDKYICQTCNTHKNRLNAHHILNWRTHKELRTIVDNGITMCKDCHKEFHMKYGKINNNAEQIKEFKFEVKNG